MSIEDAMAALFAVGQGAYAWKNAPQRRLILWKDVPAEQRPAFFQHEGKPGEVQWISERQYRRTVDVAWFVYTYLNVNDLTAVGAALMNQIEDALTAALKPVGADLIKGRQTLGGRVHHCRVEGTVLRDPGDLDGDGLLMIPIKILLP